MYLHLAFHLWWAESGIASRKPSPQKKPEVWIYLFVRICHKKSCSQLYGYFGFEKRLVTCWIGLSENLRAVKTLGFGWLFFAWYWMFIVGGSIFIDDWSSHIKSHSYTTWSLVGRCLVWLFGCQKRRQDITIHLATLPWGATYQTLGGGFVRVSHLVLFLRSISPKIVYHTSAIRIQYPPCVSVGLLSCKFLIILSF